VFTLVYKTIGSYTATFGAVIVIAVLTLFALHAGKRAMRAGD
jgi:hypothetical protein